MLISYSRNQGIELDILLNKKLNADELPQDSTGNSSEHTLPDFIALATSSVPDEPQVLEKARIFAERLLEFEVLDSGENSLAHADEVAQIVKQIGGSESLQAASYLVYASAYLSKPAEIIGKVFNESLTSLAVEATHLLKLEKQTRAKQKSANSGASNALQGLRSWYQR